MCASERAQFGDAVLTGLCMSGDVICPCTNDQGSICSRTSPYVSMSVNLKDIVINVTSYNRAQRILLLSIFPALTLATIKITSLFCLKQVLSQAWIFSICVPGCHSLLLQAE